MALSRVVSEIFNVEKYRDLEIRVMKEKKKNFIKPQYNNSINTQHCGRLPEKTNVHTPTRTHRKRDNLRT